MKKTIGIALLLLPVLVGCQSPEQRRYGELTGSRWLQNGLTGQERNDVHRECKNLVPSRGLTPISSQELNQMLSKGAKIISTDDIKAEVWAVHTNSDGSVNEFYRKNNAKIRGECYINVYYIEGKPSVLK